MAAASPPVAAQSDDGEETEATGAIVAPPRIPTENPLVKAAGGYEIKQPRISYNHNGKKSRVYRRTSPRSYGGSHRYACGVRDSFSTYAYYNFTVPENGNYEVYAYWPGLEESYDNRNNGFGVWRMYINGVRQDINGLRSGSELKEDYQWGGWEHLRIGKLWQRSNHGRANREWRTLSEGDVLRLVVHNGLHAEDPTSKGCKTRVVFPPLLLMRIGDFPDQRPYSPGHDVFPMAAQDFTNCLRYTDTIQELSGADKWARLLALLEVIAGGLTGNMPGPASADNYVRIQDEMAWWRHADQRCYDYMWKRNNQETTIGTREPKLRFRSPYCAEAWSDGAHWTSPFTLPNTSVAHTTYTWWGKPRAHQFLSYNGRTGAWIQWLDGNCDLERRKWWKGNLMVMPYDFQMDSYGKNGPR